MNITARILLLALTLLSQKVIAQLQANFTVNKPGGCAPLEIQFTNTTTGGSGSVKYKWDFGNGNSSSLKNPGATYVTQQTYSVTLTATDGGASSSITKNITVYKNPAVSISASPANGCAPLRVSFNSQATPGDGTIEKYLWDFGDGQTIADPSLAKTSHVYTVPQIPPVSLTVTNSYGCYSVATLTTPVEVYSKLEASFTPSETALCSIGAVDFSNTSVGSGNLSYTWDFGDGNTATELSPSHQFTATGTYKVKLTVKNDAGCSSVSAPVTISVGSLKADFQVPAATCVKQNLAFINQTSKPYDQIFWSIDGKDTSFNRQSGNLIARFSGEADHNIRLIAKLGNCVDTIIKTITIGAPPVVPGFLVESSNPCGTPVDFKYTDTTSNAVAWRWSHGPTNDLIDTTRFVNITYTEGVSDVVRLLVTNAQGCKSQTSRTINYIKNDIAIEIKKSSSSANSPDRGCPGLDITFTTTPLKEVTTFSWDLGDGTSSTAPEPNHIYNTPGDYRITLNYTTRTGCMGTVYYDSIHVNDVQPSDFSVAPSTTICGNSETIFSPTVVLPNRDYVWLINGAQTLYSRTPTPFVHRFDSAGVYTISLVIKSGTCADTVTKIDYITVVPPFPKIAKAINTCSDSRGLVTFSDISKKLTNWSWDFGDGSTSNYSSYTPNITHLYNQSGKYTVRLTSTNGDCTVADSLDVYVLLKQNPKLVLAAGSGNICTSDSLAITLSGYQENPYSDTVNGYSIQSLQFSDLSMSNATIDAGNWTSGFSSFVNGFETGKTDLRIITTSNYFGCADTSNFIQMKVSGPIADFSFKPVNCFGDLLECDDLSTSSPGSSIVQWEWSFGDSTSLVAYDGKSISHTYQQPGVYQIGLKVTDAGGCVHETAIDSVKMVILKGPKADFEPSAYSIFVNNTVTFKNTTTNGQNSTFLWKFSDGTKSTDDKPLFFYNKDGEFPVTLTATDNVSGCKSSVEKLITVKKVLSKFSKEVSYPGLDNCPPLIVNFVSQSENASKVSWKFGDGGEAGNQLTVTHVFTSAGKYTVTHFSYDNAGNVDSVSEIIEVKGPYATINADTLYACNNLEVKLNASTTDAVSFKWDFGDGTIVPSTDTFATHIYMTPGEYSPGLILVDSAGCSATSVVSKKILIDSLYLSVSLSQDTLVCDSSVVRFDAIAKSYSKNVYNDPITFEWLSSIDPGNPQSASSAVWNFNSKGSHTVSLVATTPYGCTETFEKIIEIKQGITAAISSSPAICFGDDIKLSGLATPTSGPIEWRWDLGNNMTSDLQNPLPYRLNQPGTHRIALEVRNEFCSDEAILDLFIQPTPPFSLTASRAYICLGDTAALFASGRGAVQWLSPVNSVNAAGYNAVVRPTVPTLYKAMLTDSIGCKAFDSVLMDVKLPINIKVPGTQVVCYGTPTELTASGASTYQWTGGGSGANSQNYLIVPTVNTTYTVVGFDGFGCFTDTATVGVSVKSLPSVNAGPDQEVLARFDVPLKPTYSNDVVKYNWSPSTYLSCTNCATTIAKPEKNIDYVITATGTNGCSASDTVRLMMLCGSDMIHVPTAFTPNGDNLNDRFNVYGSGVTIKRLAIFDRWGKVVFERKNVDPFDRNSGWDGTFKGYQSPSGVYVYMLEATCDKGESFSFNGTLTLVR